MIEISVEVLADQTDAVLRRVGTGEVITVLVADRAAVEPRPASSQRWVGGPGLDAVFAGPAPRHLIVDLGRLGR